MTQNLKPAIAADKAFVHNGKTLVLAFRQSTNEPDVVELFCGEMVNDGTHIDAQITFSFFLSETTSNADFLRDEVFNLLNPAISSKYGVFSGGGDSGDPYAWVATKIGAIQSLIKSGCSFSSVNGWVVN